MTAQLLLAIDQGTTSTRALVFNADGKVVALAQKPLTLITPQSGWVEQDPREILADTLYVCQQAMAQAATFGTIAAIGITNQRETIVVWDKHTGEPVYNAIVWQDRRTADMCARLKTDGHEPMIQDKTGLLCDPYFSGTKLAWILARTDNHARLLCGTIDTYLLWHLTGGRNHKTDVSNASRTMLFNVNSLSWDDTLLDLLNIPPSILPEVCASAGDFGISDTHIFGKSLPIRAILGDQQAALFGQGCFEAGMVKSTYGTGAFMLMHTGQTRPHSRNRLLATIAWQRDGQLFYALEGSIFVAGAAIQFLRDTLGILGDATDSEALARSVPDSDGVIFIPALTGLGAPYWRPDVRGAVLGLTRGTQKAHIVRAALEAQAFQTRDLMTAMQADIEQPAARMRVDGGLARNNFVCEEISAQLRYIVERPVQTEATAWGVAAMAGLDVGIFSSLSDVSAKCILDPVFSYPQTAAHAESYGQWQQAIRRLCS